MFNILVWWGKIDLQWWVLPIRSLCSSLFSAWICNSVPINGAIHFIINYAVTSLRRVNSDANWGTNQWKKFHYCLNGRRALWMRNVYVCFCVDDTCMCDAIYGNIWVFCCCFGIDLAAMVCACGMCFRFCANQLNAIHFQFATFSAIET